MKRIFKKIILFLCLTIVFWSFTTTPDWQSFVFKQEPVIFYSLIILTTISLAIVIFEWKSNEQTLPVIQILIGLSPWLTFYYSAIIYYEAGDPLSGFLFFTVWPYTVIPSLIFIVSGIKAIKTRKKNFEIIGEMNTNFKKIILLMYLSTLMVWACWPIIFFIFESIVIYKFIIIALIILTIFSILIIGSEWKSSKKTFPVIQILIGLSPWFSMFISYIAFYYGPFFTILAPLSPFTLILSLTFVISGTEGIKNNRKKLNNENFN